MLLARRCDSNGPNEEGAAQHADSEEHDRITIKFPYFERRKRSIRDFFSIRIPRFVNVVNLGGTSRWDWMLHKKITCASYATKTEYASP